jgi:hypothetical protein
MNPRTVRRGIVVLVVLQVVVLLAMPLLAGHRMASGTTVRLAVHGDVQGASEIGNEVRLDYGFHELKVPDGLDAGDTAYLELRGGTSGTGTARLGKVVADPEQLPDGAVWIKLPVAFVGLEDGPIQTASIDDAELRDHLRERGAAIAVVRLDPDGDPVLERIRPASAGA